LTFLLPDYQIHLGSTLDRSLLVKFMCWTYTELFPTQDFSHLTRTVEQYFSSDTPLWWVTLAEPQLAQQTNLSTTNVAILWVGYAIDQVTGIRHPHVFLLYVKPEHRRRGIATALMRYLENWARERGQHQLGLHVFGANATALNLYEHLGYQTQSLWMIKRLE